MKVLITGGSGLLGQYLNIEISKDNEILSLYNQNKGNCLQFNSAKADIIDFDHLKRIFHDFQPDAVIHSAAISTPQLTSRFSPKEVYKINVDATRNIAGLCKENNSKLFYISTDLVYAGYRGSMLKENAKLIPVSLYAETKLMGETKIQETLQDYVILRTALLFGFGLNDAKCHFHEMYNKLVEQKPVKLFTDQFRTPLSLLEAVRIISSLLKVELKEEIINLGGPERVSRYKLGEMLCDAGRFKKELLQKINMDEVPGLPKVEDVSMDTEKLRSFGIKQKTLQDAIKEILE
jgi:dTDP-4-dehydrorhamnose reductase